MYQVSIQVKQASIGRMSGKQDKTCKNSFLDVIFMIRFFRKPEKLTYRIRSNIITNQDCHDQYGVKNHRIDFKNDTTYCPESNKAKKYLHDCSCIEQKKNLLKDALGSLSVAGFGFVLVFILSYFLYSPSFLDFLYLALWGGAISFSPINITVPLSFWIIMDSFILGVTKLLVCFITQKNRLVIIEYWNLSRWGDVSNIAGMLLPVFALLVWPWYSGYFSISVLGVTLLMVFAYLITKENRVCLF